LYTNTHGSLGVNQGRISQLLGNCNFTFMLLHGVIVLDAAVVEKFVR
jgi:hypothetical protein